MVICENCQSTLDVDAPPTLRVRCPVCGEVVHHGYYGDKLAHLESESRDILLANVRLARDDAVEAHLRATRMASRVDGIVLVLSTITAGSLWFLCSSQGPHWLTILAKWVGAGISTICTLFTAYKDKVTNYRHLADEVRKHNVVFENLIFRIEDGQALSRIRAEYRAAKAELSCVLAHFNMRVVTSPEAGQIPADRHDALEAALEARRRALATTFVDRAAKIAETK